MMRKAGVDQIIKVGVTGFAMITLSFLLALMHAATADVPGLTPDAPDALWPAHLPDAVVALCIVYQVIDLEHFQSLPVTISLSKT